MNEPEPRRVPVIAVDDSDGVRLITFDRPQVRNAFNFEMYRATSEALVAAADDDNVRAVVLTGRGTVFTSGQDLAEMAAIVTGGAPPGAETGFRSMLSALSESPLPIVAAVNGAGVGLGMTLLAHCDLVLVSETARLRVPFAELGVPPEAASSYLFPAQFGWHRAARVLLASEWITADDAVEMGLAMRRCPPEALVGDALDLARRLAGYPTEAMREIKRLMRAPLIEAVNRARRNEDEAYRRLLGSAANRQALERFI